MGDFSKLWPTCRPRIWLLPFCMASARLCQRWWGKFLFQGAASHISVVSRMFPQDQDACPNYSICSLQYQEYLLTYIVPLYPQSRGPLCLCWGWCMTRTRACCRPWCGPRVHTWPVTRGRTRGTCWSQTPARRPRGRSSLWSSLLQPHRGCEAFYFPSRPDFHGTICRKLAVPLDKIFKSFDWSIINFM